LAALLHIDVHVRAPQGHKSPFPISVQVGGGSVRWVVGSVDRARYAFLGAGGGGKAAGWDLPGLLSPAAMGVAATGSY
jgi:hypothetical protein